ncbi:hypothetical protein HRD49_23265 [Corallococcus exiguus]|uniref:hypothetical protein n=1 Tax=Corallococcus exiguus TaxID=83462 RepID=UPI0015611F85|nr:hypothetical protein [Corallococcus exiguus]NRD64677.1 hypothetical protein [Corallococcus exiguus]
MRHGALMVALLLSACAKSKEERVTSREALTAERPQPRGAATVRTDEGTYSAPSVRFSVDFLEDPPVKMRLVVLSAQAEDGSTWRFRMSVGDGFVTSKHATARIIPLTALGPGLAVVDYHLAGEPAMMMDEGTLDLTVTGSHAKGEVRRTDGRVRATFEGPLTFECMVPPAWLSKADAQAAPAPVPASDEAGEVRVLDEALSTPQCRSIADAFR